MKSISLLCGFLVLTGISISAHAEYYLVYPDPYGPCMSCASYSYQPPCGPCNGGYGGSYQSSPVVYMEFHSPRRHQQSGGEMAEYAWIPTPEPPYK